MKTIATKKMAVLGIYIFSALLGLSLIGLSLTTEQLLISISGVLVLAVSVGIIIDFFRIPGTVITQDENGELHLPRGIIVAPKEIGDVSYRRASARGIQYKWGTIIISTYSATYKYRYVDDCEAVAKELTDIMYASKSTT